MSKVGVEDFLQRLETRLARRGFYICSSVCGKRDGSREEEKLESSPRRKKRSALPESARYFKEREEKESQKNLFSS